MKFSLLKSMVADFERGRVLDASEAEPVLDALISETDESVIAEVLTAWNRKGIEENEIYEFARILRRRMIPVRSRHERFIDIVGTGGSRAKSFNISTAASFVVAGAGLPVAKHGNKAATSNSGSADVLAVLGVDSAPTPETAERTLNQIGLCFMFAPHHHRLSPTLGRVRRGLGFPTIFNCVGPLCNPASAPHQLIGVWDETLVPKMANALATLGTIKSWVVRGKDGLDEISIAGPTGVREVAGTSIRSFELSPTDFGIEPASLSEYNVEDATASAVVIRAILDNEMGGNAAEAAVILNAAAALYLADRAESMADAFALAVDSLRSGQAAKKLSELSQCGKQ